jgi:hypothetical protein
MAHITLLTKKDQSFILETNAFSFAIGVIFSQLGKNNLFHLVGFYSCKFSLLKINYEIHDKKTYNVCGCLSRVVSFA